jgi:hypothetical protein
MDMEKQIRATGLLALIWTLAAPAMVEAQANPGFTYRTDGPSITITGYEGTNTDVAIPARIDGLPVTSIRAGAFVDSYVLERIIIPETVTNIGEWAFEGCAALFSVTIPGSVATIQTGTFDQCNNLTMLIISNGVTSIDDEAFLVCSSLTNVAIPDSVQTLGAYAFENCYSLTNISLSKGLRSIGKYAFAFSALMSMTIPATVTNLGESAFMGSDLTTIAVPAGITILQQQTFDTCSSLTNVTLVDGITSIGNYAFYKCSSLARVLIPNSVTNIGMSAFYGCHNLPNLTIPGSIHIADSGFFDCWGLTSVFCQGAAPTVADLAFAYARNGITYYDDYLTVYYLPGTTGWAAFTAKTHIRTMPWNPGMDPSGNLNGQPMRFGFNITGTTNMPIVVEGCTNLAGAGWLPLSTLSLTNGAVYFSDPERTNYPTRLSRIRSP